MTRITPQPAGFLPGVNQGALVVLLGGFSDSKHLSQRLESLG